MPRKNPPFNVRALTIACSDLDQSERFYRDVLGATVIPTDNGIGWWFKLGSLEINLLPNAAEPSPSEFPTHAMQLLWLEVKDIKAAKLWLEEHQVEVVDSDEGYMQIADPDGLLIEIWEIESSSDN